MTSSSLCLWPKYKSQRRGPVSNPKSLRLLALIYPLDHKISFKCDESVLNIMFHLCLILLLLVLQVIGIISSMEHEARLCCNKDPENMYPNTSSCSYLSLREMGYAYSHHVSTILASKVSMRHGIEDNREMREENPAYSVTVSLVSYATENIESYSKWAYRVNNAYAMYNDYMFYRIISSQNNKESTYQFDYEHRDVRWNKIKILREGLGNRDDLLDYGHEEEDSDYQLPSHYLVWIDADLIVLNLTLSIERIAAENDWADIIVSRDSAPESGMINTGFIIVKSSKWAADFLDTWWSSYDRATLSEQGVFTRLASDPSFGVWSRVAILEPSALNSIFHAWDNQKDSHQVLHLAGVHDVLRAAIFHFGFLNICNSNATGDDLDIWLEQPDGFRTASGIIIGLILLMILITLNLPNHQNVTMLSNYHLKLEPNKYNLV